MFYDGIGHQKAVCMFISVESVTKCYHMSKGLTFMN